MTILNFSTEKFIDWLTGPAWFPIMGLVVAILMVFCYIIGYQRWIAHKFRKCKCKRPLPYPNMLICQDCEKNIER